MSSMLPGFREADLKELLCRESRRVVIAFAASCAERMLALYQSLAMTAGREGVETLRSAVDLAWLAALGTAEVGSASVSELQDSVLALLPDEGDLPELAYAAEDAVAAIAYALGTAVDGDPQEAVWTARRAYERANEHALRVLLIDLNEPDAEASLDASPWVQQELARQQRDLRYLLSSGTDWEAHLELVRRRAAEEGKTLGGPNELPEF